MVSKLSDHEYFKGKGITPLNHALGDRLERSSWKDSLPEFSWLGLILNHYGRCDGLKRGLNIIILLSKTFEELDSLSIASVLAMPIEKQKLFYEVVLNEIDKEVLAPLTVLFRYSENRTFCEYFMVPELSFKERTSTLSDVFNKFYWYHSHDSTDLQYLVLMLPVLKQKIDISDESSLGAVKKYSDYVHEDEIMKTYRPMIRSLRLSTSLANNNLDFNNKIWKDIMLITECNLIAIENEQDNFNYDGFIDNCKKQIEFIVIDNRDIAVGDNRYDVLLGSTNYALKIFSEICALKDGFGILARQGARTIIEVYIIIKYLANNEQANSNIWEEYKLYGISKLKKIIAKSRDLEITQSRTMNLGMIEYIVNEIMWEEFLDIDFTYFDKVKIKDKFINVDEEELYELDYEYLTNYTHGFWGVVKESSMINCDTATHQFHAVPDIEDNQKLPCMKLCTAEIICKMFSVLEKYFKVPNTIKLDLSDDK